MNPLEGLTQLLLAPFRAIGEFIQSLPSPPGLPPLAQILPPSPFPAALLNPGKTYNNLEDWEIIRNDRGRIKGLRIRRDARVT